MNKNAERHLSQAATFVAKGEEFYRKAAVEIVAAQKADSTLTNAQIGQRIGEYVRGKAYGKEWVRMIVQWVTIDQGTGSLPFSEPQGEVAKRHAKSVLRNAPAEQIAELLEDLPPQKRAEIAKAAIPPPEHSSTPTDPSFLALIVRINSALIELEAMVAGWHNPAAIPTEFSRESFNDIVSKALRIQDAFDKLVEATDNEDEFQKIVRNFRVTSDVG